MNYKYKYEKYSQLLNYIQTGGSNAKETMNFEKGVKLYSKVINKSKKLENIYENFWKNIYYNDAYVFYKNAIFYYKNIQNNKFHSFFSGIINKKLYEGKCQFIEKSSRQDFKNDEEIDKIDLDDLCNLSVQVINILDTVFTVAPTIPFNISVYRIENRKISDDIFNLKEGDYYRNVGYMSTSINPWLYYSPEDDYFLNNEQKKIIMTILLPKKSSGYYMNSPFGIKYDENLKKYIGFQEYEILLPRDNIFEILNTKTINKCFFITMILKNEIIVKNNLIRPDYHIVPKGILTKREYDNIIKFGNYKEIKSEKKDFEIDNNKINIYMEYQKINKNKKNIDYADLIHITISRIKSKYLLEWEKNKPKYDSEKYPTIEKEEYDEIYNNFKKLLPKMKKIKSIYINANVLFENNYLYNFFMQKDNIVGKIIDIEMPIIFDKKLSSSVFNFMNSFICQTEGKQKNELDNYYKIDDSYPHGVIIKYKGDIKYLPLNSGTGFTFSIKQIKIKNIEKIYITDDVFYYLVEGK